MQAVVAAAAASSPRPLARRIEDQGLRFPQGLYRDKHHHERHLKSPSPLLYLLQPLPLPSLPPLPLLLALALALGR